jgi:hypothetical protein
LNDNDLCYVLNAEGDPVAESDVLKWAEWYETADRHVARDTIQEVEVSTVFMGVNHDCHGGRPVLYETMIFGGAHDQHQERYHNKVAALAGHDRAVALVRDA